MEDTSQILQLVGSLVSILLIAWLVHGMKLGQAPALNSKEDVEKWANRTVDGYTPKKISIGREGRAAITRDASGQIMILKIHGNQFAGRVLSPAASCEVKDDELIVDCGERRYGKVALRLQDAVYWSKAINALQRVSHA